MLLHRPLPLDTTSFMTTLAAVSKPLHPALIITALELQALKALAPICIKVVENNRCLDLTVEEDWALIWRLHDVITQKKQSLIHLGCRKSPRQQACYNGYYLAHKVLSFYQSLYLLILRSDNLMHCHAVFSKHETKRIAIDIMRQQLASLNHFQTFSPIWSRLKWHKVVKNICDELNVKIKACASISKSAEQTTDKMEFALFAHYELYDILMRANSALLEQSSMIPLLRQLLVKLVATQSDFTVPNYSLVELKQYLYYYCFNRRDDRGQTIRSSFRESYYSLSKLKQVINAQVKLVASCDEIKFCYELYWELWQYVATQKLQYLVELYQSYKTVDPVLLRTLVQTQLQGCHVIQVQVRHLLVLELKHGQHADQPYLKVLYELNEELMRKEWLLSQLSYCRNLLPLFKSELKYLKTCSMSAFKNATHSHSNMTHNNHNNRDIRDFVGDMSATLIEINKH